MNMIGHDDISCCINVVPAMMIEPFVNRIISICYFEKRQPFVTGKGCKVKTVLVLIVLKTDGHELKIIIEDYPFNSGVSASAQKARREDPGRTCNRSHR
jgi:hypothetical protein